MTGRHQRVGGVTAAGVRWIGVAGVATAARVRGALTGRSNWRSERV
jgi:hypothetical protein